MKMKTIVPCVLIAAAVVGALVAFDVIPLGGGSAAASGDDLVARKKKTIEERKARRDRRKGVDTRVQAEERREKPDFDLDDDEFAGLSDEMKKLLSELQDAVDNEDRRTVSKLADKILKMHGKEGDKAVPAAVRAAAVEAISWFLPATLADLMGFMADSDPDVLEEVMSSFESAIDDTSLGDRELSALLKPIAKVLSDDDALDALFLCIESDMRNSIAVDTYKYIIKNGSKACQERVMESIEDFTGEDDITDVSKLEKWLEENPDDEDDEDFYSGDKEEDDDE